jgi:hypothetical protein
VRFAAARHRSLGVVFCPLVADRVCHDHLADRFVLPRGGGREIAAWRTAMRPITIRRSACVTRETLAKSIAPMANERCQGALRTDGPGAELTGSGEAGGRPAGRCSVKVEPTPGWLSAESLPPMRSASRLAMVRPRPAPS